MPDLIPSCFSGIASGGPPASTASGPSLATSIYDTHLGLASFSWSRTVLGLSLHADLHLSPFSPSSTSSDEDGDDEHLRFRIRPWLFWKRNGVRRLHHTEGLRHRAVDVAWDLTRARFPSAGGPEPSSGFFVAVAVDGEMALVAGDMEDEAHRKIKVRRRTLTVAPVSRREHVILKGDAGGRRLYRTAARIGGSEREIEIEIGGKEKEVAGMSVAVDGMKVLQVRRLRWKFRGSERVEIDGGGGGRIQISWDLHSWLFPYKEDTAHASVAGAAAAEIDQAVFVFRFENNEDGKGEEGVSGQMEKGFSGGGSAAGRGGGLYRGLIEGYLGKNRNWSESSSGFGGGGERKKGRNKDLSKTSSSSSSSSASSAGSSTVMEWASSEEAGLHGVDGFTLVVFASRT